MAGLDLYFSGGAANQFASGSIGGGQSTTKIVDATLNNLFDDVTRVEVINGRTEYRLFWIQNTDAQDYYRTRAISIAIPADTEIAFALDPEAIQGKTPQLLTTEDSTPVGLKFFEYADWTNLKLPIGQLGQAAPGDRMAIWIKRKVLVGSSLLRTVSLTFDGTNNALSITQDFNTVKSSFDNVNMFARSDQFFTDVDFVGEALLS
jgi:hypothetical protein